MAATCPICTRSLDVQTATPPQVDSQIKPKPGDITTCFNCGEILTFNDALNLVPVTPEMRAQVERDPGYRRFLQHVKNLPRMN
jgi:hypothetical protein